MPIYEYACARCRETIEALQKLSDPDLKTHRGCGGALSRLVSVPSVRVKENDGMSGSLHSSILRADDNRKIAKDKKTRRPATVVNLPGHSGAGAGSPRTPRKTKSK